MTDDRSFERAARSWLEIGPTEAPERAIEAAFLEIDTTPQERDWHVPWRSPRVDPFARALIGVAAVAALLVGGVVLLPATTGPIGGVPTPSPSASPSAAGRFPLTGTFTSPIMGYSIRIADGWTVQPATMAWDGTINNEPPAADVVTMTGTDSTITIASQSVPVGTSYEQWLGQFHQDAIPGVPAGCDGGDPSKWRHVQVGPETGAVENLCNAEIAFVDVSGRIYSFWLGSATLNTDQHLSEGEFYDVLKSVTFDPTGVPDAIHLTQSFTSSLMGFTMPMDPTWTATQAATPWVGHDDSSPMVDDIAVTGTVSHLDGASQPIPAGMTFDQWLMPFHAFTTAHVVAGCDGGDPSTWTEVPIGQATGRTYHACNADSAVVGYQGRAYVFDLSNSTSTTTKDQLPSGIFLAMLRDMELTPETAVDTAPGTSPSAAP